MSSRSSTRHSGRTPVREQVDARTLAPSIRKEIVRRASAARRTGQLPVDFYRIRQRLFLPLPVGDFPENLSSVRGLEDYPYAIWVLWALEERILALGWAAEWDGDSAAVSADLAALAGWTRYRQLEIPDLCSAHLTRIFCRSLEREWVSEGLRKKIFAALRHIVDDGIGNLPPLPEGSTAELMAQGVRFPNIPTIGALGLGMAAARCRHPRADEAREHARRMAGLWLAWGEQGHVEGVSYDGYTADFVMDWLEVVTPDLRRAVLAHPRWPRIVDEIRHLGAPRCAENLAPLGDVEPAEMRFHYSFAAKFLSLCPGQDGFRFPRRARQFLRCDALPFLPARRLRPPAPAELHDAHYALVLQRGPDVKAVVSWSHSTFGHMQRDTGSLVIGVGGEWLLGDPGYRQYLPTSEQAFSLGPAAHNVPVINGECVSRPLPDRKYEVPADSDGRGLRLGLGAAYAKLKGSYFRQILFDAAGSLVVEDCFDGGAIRRLDYHWHGDPRAAWRVADGCACILGTEGHQLRFSCPDAPFSPSDLQRLRGSRGHLSLVKTFHFSKPRKRLRLRWVFEIIPAGSSILRS